jgi:formylglycine-generating enzyme required for sulfatase activity
MDAEPISVLAFSRFLNSAEGMTPESAANLCGVGEGDRRNHHFQLEHQGKSFVPKSGTERQPIVLVSFHGAAAYAAWANRADWRNISDAQFLPSEAQWEYAARGASFRTFPWGEEEPTKERAWVGLHSTRESYPDVLPLADVNASLGMSPFGLHHMCGNVWQWCRDWYNPDFYHTDAAMRRDPVNWKESGIKAERGGSWVGPGSIAKSSYRRGRPPTARGRCLGFRCIGQANDIENDYRVQ